MTKSQLIEESLKPSTNWVEAGSGHTGKMYLEILGWYVKILYPSACASPFCVCSVLPLSLCLNWIPFYYIQ